MAEQTVYNNCAICGGALDPERSKDALCEHCTEAWERESESHW